MVITDRLLEKQRRLMFGHWEEQGSVNTEPEQCVAFDCNNVYTVILKSHTV